MPFDCKPSIAPILSDFSNAFNSVPHQRLFLKLTFYAIHCHTLTWIEHFLTNHTQSTVLGRRQSGICIITSGVAQGYVLSPLLFPIYLPLSMTSPTISLRKFAFFADDCTIDLELSSATSPQQLQAHLNSLSLWASKWQMHFNCSKCYSMHITHSTSPVITT